MWIIKKHCNRLKLNDAAFYVIGSVAKGEPSCIKVWNDRGKRFLVISDLDLVVFTNLLTYFKCILLRCNRYIEELERFFLKKSIEFHISFSPLPLWVYRLGLFKPNSIDYYELAIITCFEDKRSCKILPKDRSLNIDKHDILNLAISSFIDFLSVTLKSGDKLNSKDVYILSKRILTLLYCIELYFGLKPQSFSETPLVATMNFEKLKNLVDKSDLKLLNTLSEIKSCNSCQKIDETWLADKSKLVYLYKKLLRRFLTLFSSDLGTDNILKRISHIEENFLIPRRKLPFLLFLYIALYSIKKFLRRDASEIRDELVIMIRYRMRLQDLLRLLALKYAILLLTKDRLAIKDINLIRVGLELVNTWYKYMVP